MPLTEDKILNICAYLKYVKVKPAYAHSIILSLISNNEYIKLDKYFQYSKIWGQFTDEEIWEIGCAIPNDYIYDWLIEKAAWYYMNDYLLEATYKHGLAISNLPADKKEKNIYLLLYTSRADKAAQYAKKYPKSIAIATIFHEQNALHLLSEDYINELYLSNSDLPEFILDICHKPPNGIAWLHSIEKMKLEEEKYNNHINGTLHSSNNNNYT